MLRTPRQFDGGPIDRATLWYLIVGALLISMGLLSSLLKRLPLSPPMFYLVVGYLLGPGGTGIVDVHPGDDPLVLMRMAEAALLLSLFTVGLKLRAPIGDALWQMPVRLGLLGMLLTVLALSVLGIAWLGLPLGGALLLAGMLAPTDPVLASDVQVRDVGDRDRIRFALSGEGGLNDATAFPFVMAGLALLGVPEAASWHGSRALLQAGWGFAAGMLAGWLWGHFVALLVVYLRRRFRSALGMEEFLTLGLIALSFGTSEMVHANGFIAVFMAGVAVRGVEARMSGGAEPAEIMRDATRADDMAMATGVRTAPAYMTEALLGFNQQLEHIGEFTMVLLLGILISSTGLSWRGVILAAVLFCVIRPLSVLPVLTRAARRGIQPVLLMWFGIRGIGSLYYLLNALRFRAYLPQDGELVRIVLTVIACSILVHGISSTPLMNLYQRRKRRFFATHGGEGGGPAGYHAKAGRPERRRTDRRK